MATSPRLSLLSGRTSHLGDERRRVSKGLSSLTSSLSSFSLSPAIHQQEVHDGIGKPGSLHASTRHPDDPLQSQMAGLQSRVSTLGKQINDMYRRTEGGEDLPMPTGSQTLHAATTMQQPYSRSVGSASPGPAAAPSAARSLRWSSHIPVPASTYSSGLQHAAMQQATKVPAHSLATYEAQIPLPKPAWLSSTSSTQPYSSPGRHTSAASATSLRGPAPGTTSLRAAYHPMSEGDITGARGAATRASHLMSSGAHDTPKGMSSYHHSMAAPGSLLGSGAFGALGSALLGSGDGGRHESSAAASRAASAFDPTGRSASAFGRLGGSGSMGGHDGIPAARPASGFDSGSRPASSFDRLNHHSQSAWEARAAGSLVDSGGSRDGMLHSGRMQQLEEERLRSWIQELRHERRRLEDRLLSNDPQGIRTLDFRDDLEKQVQVLSRQRDGLEADIESVASLQQAVHELTAEVGSLRQALQVETEQNLRQQAARSQLECELAEVGKQLEALMQQHTQMVEELQQDKKVLLLKYKKSAQKASGSDQEVEKLKLELQHARTDLQAKEVQLSETKASSEVLQHANTHLQAQMSSSSRELEGRILDLQQRLEEQLREVNAARQQTMDSAKEAAAAEAQVKELSSRADFLRSEREKLLKVLQAEQQQSASLKQSVEALQGQIRSVEGQKVDLDSNARIQLEALQRQYEIQASTATKQYELQIAALDKQYSSLQKQYDASVQSHEKLLGIHNGLRKERDELWAEADRLRSEVTGLQNERNELGSKLAALRGEVKYTMDDVIQDRENRLQALSQQHGQAVHDIKEQYEKRLADMQSETEAKLKGALEVANQLQQELGEAQQSSDKHRGAVVHLKEQLKDALVSRDDLQRDLEAEREFSRELNRIVNQIRSTETAATPPKPKSVMYGRH